ncbi:MAG: hypothetical protein AB1486_26410 [Planctomycetota bacterium]
MFLAAEVERALLMGGEGDFVKGGQGGDGGRDESGTKYQGRGGAGGIGLAGDAEVSDVALLAGLHGKGYHGFPLAGYGGDGYRGDVTFVDPPYPLLDLPDELRAGQTINAIVRGESGSQVVILFSDTRGWVDLPNVRGHPLVALPGGSFVRIDAGTIGPSGKVEASIDLPKEQALWGLVLTVQALVTTPAGSLTLTNAPTRVVGP